MRTPSSPSRIASFQRTQPRQETHQPDLHHSCDGPRALLSSLSADTLLLSAGFSRRPPVIHPRPQPEDARLPRAPLDPMKHETKNQLAKSGQGMPVRTHDGRPRTPVVVASPEMVHDVTRQHEAVTGVPDILGSTPAASASSWPECLTPRTSIQSITAVEVPAEGCVATSPYPPYAWSRQPSCSSHPSCSLASSGDSEPDPVDTATHAPSATRAAPFGAPTAPRATPTAPPARKDGRGGGSERGEIHLADHGQVGMTKFLSR